MSNPSVDEEVFARRIAALDAGDPQFAAARPDAAVGVAVDEPGLRLPQIVTTVMEAYADRPALGGRAVEYVTDTAGRTVAQFLPRYDTITYVDDLLAVADQLGKPEKRTEGAHHGAQVHRRLALCQIIIKQ